jgi:hypothetical protein
METFVVTNRRGYGTPIVPNITELLVAWNQGDQNALAQLTPLVYRELHRLAHGQWLVSGAVTCCKPRH